MDAIEHAAHQSVGRACGFCGLAIICFMVGFSYDPHIAARVGGTFALATALVLSLKAKLALTTHYKRTETWLILEQDQRPPPEVAQNMIGRVLYTVFLTYALYSGVTSAVLLATSVLIGVLQT